MQLDAAEMQLLASLDKAEAGNTATDRETLDNNGEWFWVFGEGHTSALASLSAKGLIEGDGRNPRLTESGRPLARAYNRERPDLFFYFYQKFYPTAHASAAHSRLCEAVFGQDLCQDGQVDMAALQDLLRRLDLKSGNHVLDLGCGAGVIAKYIAEQTGARVTGLDFAATAIAEARARAATEGSRLTFLQGDIDSLDFPAGMFDAVISLDSLYWVTSLTDTLSRMAQTVRPGGRLGIFMEQGRTQADPPEILNATNTDLARALDRLGLGFETHDYSAQNVAFWRRMRQATADLRPEFEAEGNGFIAASLARQVGAFLPAMEAGEITRYLYIVQL